MVDLTEYFRESNAIEGVHEDAAVEDAFNSWEYLTEQSELTHDVVKTAHELLMQRRQPRIAGEYRDIHVRVGRDRPPAPGAVPPLMTDLLDRSPDTAADAIAWHVDFEKIHPFADGNGRIGRLIYAWHCIEELGVPPVMWRADDVDGYYALFQTAEPPNEPR